MKCDWCGEELYEEQVYYQFEGRVCNRCISRLDMEIGEKFTCDWCGEEYELTETGPEHNIWIAPKHQKYCDKCVAWAKRENEVE